ncbi:Trp biosynthesis-associated membrane protein [Actinomadura fibrosa]|uniref:Trp biosynthesis-associated membrane protein n=1 Tax=Actinomadura fibrosa TaxID=111802 RepID=A0ABW2XN70_9ACTN|nr:Trp biosynthesis-associated membrane protein [Actinomadura fibrosa]
MSPGRERGLVALLCAAGAGLVLLAAGRTWVTVRAGAAITPVPQDLSGRDLGGTAGALGLAGLAGLAALFATSGRVRAAVGVLIFVFGAGIVYGSASAVQRSNVLDAVGERRTLLTLDAHPVLDVNLWWMVSVTGGVVLAVGGLVTVVRGARWPGMSARYERSARPAAVVGQDSSAMWKSLDRGEDPTESRDGRP